MKLLGTLCFILFSTLTFAQASAPAASVDLELVLAVDVSGSIDARETALQREGYLAAIRSPEFRKYSSLPTPPLRQLR